jgi:hypothetical protein
MSEEINRGVAVLDEIAKAGADPRNSGGDPELPGGMELAAGPDGTKPEYQNVFGEAPAAPSPAAYEEPPVEYAADEPAPRKRRSRKAAVAEDASADPQEPAEDAAAEPAGESDAAEPPPPPADEPGPAQPAPQQ